MQSGSEHPLARAVLDAARARIAETSWPPLHEARAVPGRGTEGTVAGTRWRIGSLQWMRDAQVDLSALDAAIAQAATGGATLSVLA
ncbi:MAG: HAD family hydrolase, partial [Betaproteobacteria bacterium]|nr:HAD family hydrolase [Betaproteobacteria bacterium]